MAASRPRAPTTEEHRPPTADQAPQGRSVLLAAFPKPVAVQIPTSGAVLGRAWLDEAGITDGEISGEHLRIHRVGGALQVEDAGSRNGTWVDGHPIARGERVPLDDGAILRIGRTVLVFREAFADPLEPDEPLGQLVGPWGLRPVRAALAALAARCEPDRNVLLQGETGTGKELLAEEVARALGRHRKFSALNMTSVPPGVFEAHLFGWIKGAYSGSADGGVGMLREHHGGAVFLDEIGELPLALQPKLLRLLENRQIVPVGAGRPIAVDVAIVAASNRPLADLVEREKFRRDLLARFAVRIALPPLRDRPEDLFAIVAALWSRRRGRLDPRRVQVEAVELLMLQDWPANIRDLDRVLAGADPAAGLKLADVHRVLGEGVAVAPPPPTRPAIERVLAECGGNKTSAARRLGISRGRLLRLLRAVERG